MKKEEITPTEEELNKTPNNEQNTEEQAAEAAPDTENTTEAEPAEEKDPLDVALAEIEELKTQALYKAAEFENFRKRTIAEKTELILNGGQNVIKAVLPVLDDIERAIENAPKADSVEALEEGWELIAKKLNKILEGLGVQKINTENADFDTDFHEAIALVPGMGDDKKGKIIDCVQAGYTLNDKVIRHAKVAVGQ
ncbi:MAG: nucleotide exchange factor GrpE [Prevotellaceae bacterium]|nr:nucleotide exchange factor GrpE [Prevotellaceae bacterium]